MSIDLNTLSARELAALISQAKKRKTTLDKRKPAAAVRSKLTALAKAEGYSIAELFGGKVAKQPTAANKTTSAKKASPSKGRKLGKVAPKYRNPDNARETWSGRGMQPRWMAELTAQGKTVEDFLIRA